jgi:hypothetical protein
MKNYLTIWIKSLKPHTITNNNLKKCNAFDDVLKSIKDYLTISTKIQDPQARTNKIHETLL